MKASLAAICGAALVFAVADKLLGVSVPFSHVCVFIAVWSTMEVIHLILDE